MKSRNAGSDARSVAALFGHIGSRYNRRGESAVGTAATFDLRERADLRSVAAERTASIPWYVWCLAAATAADFFGGYWDISWHVSIGRDSFWTPAHMMIYLAGVLAGVASGYAILSTTFGESQEAKDAGISVWGLD